MSAGQTTLIVIQMPPKGVETIQDSKQDQSAFAGIVFNRVLKMTGQVAFQIVRFWRLFAAF
jgi:hypothetical protein